METRPFEGLLALAWTEPDLEHCVPSFLSKQGLRGAWLQEAPFRVE